MHIAREKGLLGEYYNDRLELIDHMHELSRRIARMKLLGVAAWDKEDYELAYAIKAGVVQLPKGALFEPESYMLDGKGANEKAIARGLFNVHRYTKPRTDAFRVQDPFPNLPVNEPESSGNWIGVGEDPLRSTIINLKSASKIPQFAMDGSARNTRWRPA